MQTVRNYIERRLEVDGDPVDVIAVAIEHGVDEIYSGPNARPGPAWWAVHVRGWRRGWHGGVMSVTVIDPHERCTGDARMELLTGDEVTFRGVSPLTRIEVAR